MATTNPIQSTAASLDVPTIVKQLVAAKRAPLDKAISDKTTANTTQISAIGNFTSSLTALQTAMKNLTDGTAFTTQKVSVGDDDIISAVAGNDAQPNHYDIDVKQLATAQRTTSGAFANGDAKVGTGSLTISVGGKSMTLDIDGTNNSLSTIKDKINKATDNPGVTASIITDTKGSHLVLSSSTTGAANAFKVTSSGGDGGLATLNFDPATDKPTVAAQDAEYTIDGSLQVTSPTNSDSKAIDGVTLTLSKVGTSSLDITNDPSSVTGAMQSLVTAYNTFIGTYQQLTKYDPTNQQVGALIGDATVSSIKSQVSSLLGEQFTGNKSGPTSLSNLGVSFQTDGTLKFDSTQLTKALTNNPKETQNLLSGPNGIAPTLDKLISGWTSTTGILTQRTNNLNQTTKDLTDQTADIDQQMQDYSDRLTKQYTALDTLVTKLSSTFDFITQQFDALSAGKS